MAGSWQRTPTRTWNGGRGNLQNLPRPLGWVALPAVAFDRHYRFDWQSDPKPGEVEYLSDIKKPA